MTDNIKPDEDARHEAADLRMIAAALGGEKFPYAPSLLSAALTIERLVRENDGLYYVIHAGNCDMCNPLNRPNTICSHGAKLLESARPGATANMKVLTYAR